MQKRLVFWDWLGTLILPNGSDRTEFIPYAWALVEWFAKQGYAQVIVSNGGEREIKSILSAAPFRKFDLILTVDQFPPKPEVAMFLYALENCNFSNAEAYYIGDHSIDAQAAQKLKIDFAKVDGTLASYMDIASKFNCMVC